MGARFQREYYNILGVPPSASQSEIEAAFRRLVRKYHPQVNPGDPAAAERYHQILAAFEVLGEERKRTFLDSHGYYDPVEDSEQGGAVQREQTKRSPTEVIFEGFDLEEINRSFGDVVDQLLGSERKTSVDIEQPGLGGDIEYPLAVTFEQVLKGFETTITISRMQTCMACSGSGLSDGSATTCPHCHGTGKHSLASGGLRLSSACEHCKGTGRRVPACAVCGGPASGARVRATESVTVRIPAGVDTGSRIRVPGKGDDGPFGGPPGDLWIVTNAGEHPFFIRKGDNLHSIVPITVVEAILGTHVEVPTVDGSTTLRVPPGCQPGQVFRLREKGLPSLRGAARGDQYVEIKVTIPRVADARSRALVEEFSRLNPDNPREGLVHAGEEEAGS